MIHLGCRLFRFLLNAESQGGQVIAAPLKFDCERSAVCHVTQGALFLQHPTQQVAVLLGCALSTPGIDQSRSIAALSYAPLNKQFTGLRATFSHAGLAFEALAASTSADSHLCMATASSHDSHTPPIWAAG